MPPNPSTPSPDPSPITIVSGIPRSGTSLMMQMLGAGGMPLLTDDQRPPDSDNPRGYFEFDRAKRLRTDQSWVNQAAGSAVKVIHFLLPELPINDRLVYRVIFMRRPIDEILASQQAMLDRLGKPTANHAVLRQAYESQLRSAEQWMTSHSSVRALNIDYRQVIDRPREVSAEVCAFLGLSLNLEAMAAAVDPKLHRQRSS